MTNKNVLILGIGNLLWADEGFGVRAAETFSQYYQYPSNVQVMDGGTQGMYLVPHVEQADILVIFDAIDYGLAPGTLKLIYDEDVPAFMGAKKMSLHQTGFQEVLATASLLDRSPEKLILIGVQPALLEDYGGSLTDTVKSQIHPAIKHAAHYLTELGFDIKRRNKPLENALNHAITDTSLAIDNYEYLRPNEQQACRKGDPRFVFSNLAEFDPKPIEDMPSPMSVAIDHRKSDPCA